MRLETGIFLKASGATGWHDKFTARVVISASEQCRLGIGLYESPVSVPACFAWCFDRFGPGGARWSVDLPHDRPAVVYFVHAEDAARFATQFCEAPDDMIDDMADDLAVAAFA